MAEGKYIYFADMNGETVQWTGTGSISNILNKEFAERFPDVTNGKRFDSFTMQVFRENDKVYPVTRVVKYKKFASKHDCDPRCTGARGRTMNCECACGGKNHGRMF